ncbi:MAG: ABC transporter permease [Halanaerobiaceae bacterium]
MLARINSQSIEKSKWEWFKEKTGGLGPLLVLGMLLVVLSILSEDFFTSKNLFNIARQSSINLIVAVGMTIVIISAGIDLSVGSNLAFTGCIIALGAVHWGLSPLLAILLGIGAGLVVGSFNGFVISRVGIPDFIMGLGLLSALRSLSLIITEGMPVSGIPQVITFFGAGTIFKVIPMPAVVALLMTVAGWFILNYTHLGRCAFAIGGNIEAARAAGINVKNAKVKIYALCGFFVSIGALVQLGRIYSANPTMGSGLELEAIAAVIIGGTNLFGGEGTVSGTVVGALIMGVIGNGLNLLDVSTFWQDFFVGSMIILVVVIDQLRRG